MNISKLFEGESRAMVYGRPATLRPLDDKYELDIAYDDGRTSRISRTEVTDLFTRGDLQVISTANEMEPPDPRLMGELPIEKLDRLALRATFVSDFMRGGYARSRPQMKKSIERTAARLNLGVDDWRPSVSTLHDWIKETRALGPTANPLNALAPKRRNRDSRIPVDIERLMHDAIDAAWMTRERRTKAHAYRVFKRLCELHLGIQVGLRFRSTFYQRITDLDPLSKTAAREGPDKAREMAHYSTGQNQVDTILEQVQIDAVHLAQNISDTFGAYLGYPVVHVAIDVRTRAVLGFAVELSSESAAGVLDCLKHAFRVKRWAADHPYTENEWVMFGRPYIIISDGGAAQMAETVANFLAMLGITRTACQSKTPWHKDIIERFNRTVRDNFADHLPGYVGRFDNPKGHEHLICKAPSMTLEAFITELTKYIVDDYNQSKHSSFFGQSPHSLWIEHARIAPPMEASGLEYASRIHGKWDDRVYDGTNGIRINNVAYNDPDGVLHSEYLKRSQGRTKQVKFRCLYNDSDISSITVQLADNRLIVAPVRKAEGYIAITQGMTLQAFDAERERRREEAEEKNKNAGGHHINYGVSKELERMTAPKPEAKKSPKCPKSKRSAHSTETANQAKKAFEAAQAQGLKASATPQEISESDFEDFDPSSTDVLASLVRKSNNFPVK